MMINFVCSYVYRHLICACHDIHSSVGNVDTGALLAGEDISCLPWFHTFCAAERRKKLGKFHPTKLCVYRWVCIHKIYDANAPLHVLFLSDCNNGKHITNVVISTPPCESYASPAINMFLSHVCIWHVTLHHNPLAQADWRGFWWGWFSCIKSESMELDMHITPEIIVECMFHEGHSRNQISHAHIYIQWYQMP